MNLGRNAKKRMATIGALIAPVVMVQIVRWVFDAPSGPSIASAATPTGSDTTIPSAAAPKPTKEQQAAGAWARGVQIARDMKSPMDHGEKKPSVEPTEPSTPAPKPTEVDPAAAIADKLAVGAIFGGRAGQMATINGRVFGVGEEPAPGWRVSSIDIRSGVVTLSGPSDKTIELRVQSRDRK